MLGLTHRFKVAWQGGEGAAEESDKTLVGLLQSPHHLTLVPHYHFFSSSFSSFPPPRTTCPFIIKENAGTGLKNVCCADS